MSTTESNASRVRFIAAGVLALVVVVVLVLVFSGGTKTSTSSKTYLREGVIAQKHGQLRKAAILYVQAIRKDPHNALAYYDLATVEQIHHHPILALTHYKDAVRLRPSFDRAWYNMGVIEKKMDYRIAEADFAKAIAANPGLAAADLNLGLLEVAHGNRASGINHINLAITMQPSLRRAVPAALKPFVH